MRRGKQQTQTTPQETKKKPFREKDKEFRPMQPERIIPRSKPSSVPRTDCPDCGADEPHDCSWRKWNKRSKDAPLEGDED